MAEALGTTIPGLAGTPAPDRYCGNLAPSGAVIKPAAASPSLLRHRGRAVVFDSIEDMHHRIDDPDLEADEDSVLVLRGCGPKGYPGMPEVANLPLPPRLLRRGIRDMVRICDGRMSGTAYGTVVLHVTPEVAAGGPLGRVQTGDYVILDVAARRLDVDVPAAELAGRRPSAAMAAGFAAPRRAGSDCTSIMSCRLTPALTWTSCSAPAARQSPATRTEPGRLGSAQPGRPEKSHCRAGRNRAGPAATTPPASTW